MFKKDDYIEMENMEDFFKRNKKRDIEFFFSEQWKPYFRRQLRKNIKATIICLLIEIIMGCLVYFSRKESSKEAGIWIFIISFAVLLMGLFSIYMCTWRTQRFQYSYSKAKVKFQKLYPDYTNLKLSNEIEKNDKKRAIISTLYGITINIFRMGVS